MNQSSKYDPRGPLPTDKVYQARKPLPHLLRRYVVAESGCWEWTGTRNRQGYGVVGIAVNKRPTGFPAPRLQWMHCHGEIPEGQVIMHTCDNPPCVNPDHLRLGSQSDNLKDAVAKGRRSGGSRPDRYKTVADEGHRRAHEERVRAAFPSPVSV
jgi:hypothetical protein